MAPFKVACNSIMAERPKNLKYYIILKNHFCGIVSLLFRQKKDILVAWMHMKHKKYKLFAKYPDFAYFFKIKGRA